jgi:hypothetical protein
MLVESKRNCIIIIIIIIIIIWNRSVGIATRYGLDSPGIKSRWGARFSAPVQIGGKAAGAWRSPPTPSTVKVKERVALYL